MRTKSYVHLVSRTNARYTRLDLGSASPKVTNKEKNIKEKNIKDKAKIKNEECNTGYPPINEAILLEMM